MLVQHACPNNFLFIMPFIRVMMHVKEKYTYVMQCNAF